MTTPPASEKRLVLRALVAKLQSELETLALSAKAAHEAATHEESKAEDQYDTRGLESSYLAAAQAARAEELDRQIQYFAAGPEDTHVLALLRDEDGNESRYLLTRFGGGTKIQIPAGEGVGAGRTYFVVTPESPLGSELAEKKIGDSIEIGPKGRAREFDVIAID